jgi:hypothetical protein
MLGRMHLEGLGTPRNARKAVDWFERLALARNVNAHKLRFNHLKPTLASGGVEARILLANLHADEKSELHDPKKARYWYGRAEEVNYVPARYVVATMLERGYGGSVDVAKALKLYRDAAEHGYAPAQYRLADMYANGTHVQRDPAEAFRWYEQVAFHPLPGPNKMDARYALAQFYDRCEGTQRDTAKALALYRLAAVGGHAGAINALATYFYAGELVQRDQELSRKLFLAGAERGHGEAMVNAGAMLYQGEGGGRDPVTAYVWLYLANKLGNARAPKALASLEKVLSAEQRSQASALLGSAATPR